MLRPGLVACCGQTDRDRQTDRITHILVEGRQRNRQTDQTDKQTEDRRTDRRIEPTERDSQTDRRGQTVRQGCSQLILVCVLFFRFCFVFF
jgi:hypothetical protein